MDGRVAVVEGTGGDILRAMLDRTPVRPVGSATSALASIPTCRPVGWTLVGERLHGSLFVALGENRYLGGENASSLSVDFAVPGATLLVDDRIVDDAGVVAVLAIPRRGGVKPLLTSTVLSPIDWGKHKEAKQAAGQVEALGAGQPVARSGRRGDDSRATRRTCAPPPSGTAPVVR